MICYTSRSLGNQRPSQIILKERKINDPLSSTAKLVIPDFGCKNIDHYDESNSENIDPNTVRGVEGKGIQFNSRPNKIPRN